MGTDFSQAYTGGINLPSVAQEGQRAYAVNGRLAYFPTYGATSLRPVGAPVGHTYWDTTTNALVVWNGAVWQSTATSAVTSVFGRTGNVVAAPGDYNTTQVTNSSTVTGSTLTAALNALKTLTGRTTAAAVGSEFAVVAGVVTALPRSGTTAQRPAGAPVGWTYRDTTIGEEIYWSGAGWRTSRYLEAA